MPLTVVRGSGKDCIISMKTMVFATAICSLCMAAAVWSADDVKKEAPTPPATATPSFDPFAVPEGANPLELVEFCKNVLQEGRKVHNQAEFDVYISKMHPAIQRASEIILTLENNQSSENARFARRNLFGLSIKPASNGSDADSAKFAEKLAEFVCAKDVEPTREDVGLLLSAGRMLELKNPAQAKKLYTSVIPTLKKSPLPTIDRIVLTLEASVRRLSLVGSELAIKGTMVSGKPFDMGTLKGKVVLVDFWATWCRYCIQEFPNMKKNYAGYHNKGFEVVSISVDQDRPKLDEFLFANPLPWILLHDEGGQNEAIERCGVISYPTTFMIGKSGKVISVFVRGDELDKLLKQELGDPDPIPQDSAPQAGETKK